MDKTYLGDSVYAEFDGYHIVLTTENGLEDDPSNRIALEPAVIDSLLSFRTSCFGENKDDQSDDVPEIFSYVIRNTSDYLKRIRASMRKHGDAYQEVLSALSGVTLQSASPDGVDLNINLAGTKSDLETVWGTLRRLGFDAPYERPEANQPEFCGTFRRKEDDCSVWLKFTSTVCKRVQTGTRVEEIPVYEVVCE